MPKKPRKANAVVVFEGGRKLLLWTICEKLAPFTDMTAHQLYILLRYTLAVRADVNKQAWGIQMQIAKELEITPTHVSHVLANLKCRKLPTPEQLKEGIHRSKDFKTHVLSKGFVATNTLVILAMTESISTDLSQMFKISQNLISTQVPELALILSTEVKAVEYVEPHRSGGEKVGESDGKEGSKEGDSNPGGQSEPKGNEVLPGPV